MIFALAAAPIAQYVLGGILIFLALVLVASVLLQSAKDKRLSGTIAGGAETFFGKTKGSGMDKLLSRVTIVVAVLVVIITIVLGILIN